MIDESCWRDFLVVKQAQQRDCPILTIEPGDPFPDAGIEVVTTEAGEKRQLGPVVSKKVRPIVTTVDHVVNRAFELEPKLPCDRAASLCSPLLRSSANSKA